MAKLKSSKDNVEIRKLSPKLRMIANGDFNVNRVRAEFNGSVGILSDTAIEEEVIRHEQYVSVRQERSREEDLKKPLTEPSKNILTNAFVELSPEWVEKNPNKKIPGETARKGNIASIRVPISELHKLTLKESYNT
ncbi:MAG: hypothetical protein GH151_08385 [Bacteroidetes bacterium]|nr:hypothetical protein [Bacteroidota bacterium]